MQDIVYSLYLETTVVTHCFYHKNKYKVYIAPKYNEVGDNAYSILSTLISPSENANNNMNLIQDCIHLIKDYVNVPANKFSWKL